MAPPPTILVLENAQIYIGISDGGNKASYIKASVDKSLCLTTTLDIPDIDLYDCYI